MGGVGEDTAQQVSSLELLYISDTVPQVIAKINRMVVHINNIYLSQDAELDDARQQLIGLKAQLEISRNMHNLGVGGVISKLQKDNPSTIEGIDYDFDTGKHIIKIKSGAAGQYKADSQPSADIKYAEGKAHTAHFVIPYFIYETLGPNKSRALEEAILAFYRVKLQELKS